MFVCLRSVAQIDCQSPQPTTVSLSFPKLSLSLSFAYSVEIMSTYTTTYTNNTRKEYSRAQIAVVQKAKINLWKCIYKYIYIYIYSCGQNFTYTLQYLQNVNYFTKIREIMQNACYFYLVLTRGVRYKKKISIFWGFFSITVIRRHFGTCVFVLIADYSGQLQFLILSVPVRSHQW